MEVIIVIVLIIVAILISLFAFVSIYSTGKNKSKQPEKKIEAEPSPEPVSADDFKVVKKSRLARVNKKALKADSRSATLTDGPTIEKVFVREPEKSQEEEFIEVSQTLSKDSEDLLEAMQKIEGEERKVVSLGELKKENEQKEQARLEAERLEPEVLVPERIRHEHAGEIMETYSGFGVGANKDLNKTSLIQQPETQDEPEQEEQDPDFFRNRFMDRPPFFDSPDFNPFRQRSFGYPEQQPKKKFDLNDAVQSEAILNPKFKNNKDKNKK